MFDMFVTEFTCQLLMETARPSLLHLAVFHQTFKRDSSMDWRWTYCSPIMSLPVSSIQSWWEAIGACLACPWKSSLVPTVDGMVEGLTKHISCCSQLVGLTALQRDERLKHRMVNTKPLKQEIKQQKNCIRWIHVATQIHDDEARESHICKKHVPIDKRKPIPAISQGNLLDKSNDDRIHVPSVDGLVGHTMNTLCNGIAKRNIQTCAFYIDSFKAKIIDTYHLRKTKMKSTSRIFNPMRKNFRRNSNLPNANYRSKSKRKPPPVPRPRSPILQSYR